MISFYIHSKRLHLKHTGLSDTRIVALTKQEYGFMVHFFVKSHKSLGSISDE